MCVCVCDRCHRGSRSSPVRYRSSGTSNTHNMIMWIAMSHISPSSVELMKSKCRVSLTSPSNDLLHRIVAGQRDQERGRANLPSVEQPEHVMLSCSGRKCIFFLQCIPPPVPIFPAYSSWTRAVRAILHKDPHLSSHLTPPMPITLFCVLRANQSKSLKQ